MFGLGWIRTSDARLFKPPLYHLSYQTLLSEMEKMGIKPTTSRMRTERSIN